MRKRIRTAMKTTVRSAFKTVRLIKNYQKFQNKTILNLNSPSFVLALETGTFTSLSGCGSMFDNYVKNGNFGNHSGKNEKLRYPDERNFCTSKLRVLPFDHTFTFLPIDVNKRKQNKLFYY